MSTHAAMSITWAFLVLVAGLGLLIPTIYAFRTYLRCDSKQALLWWLLAVAIAVGLGFQLTTQPGWRGSARYNGEMENILLLLGRCLLPMFLLPLIVRQIRLWLFDIATPDEKLPGPPGFRAALALGNIVCVIGVTICAYLGWNFSPWAGAALSILAVLALPLGHTLAPGITSAPVPAPGSASTAVPPAPENLTAERERVLKLLEDGKITSDESAELLNALGSTVVRTSVPTPLAPSRRIVVVGAAIVLIGFFLPWFAVNVGAEVNRAVGQFQQQMQSQGGQFGGNMNMGPDLIRFNTGTSYITGGDIGRYMGWMILALSLASAVIVLIPHLAPSTVRLVGFLCLAAGAIFIAYLLTGALRHIHIGMIVVIVGYGLQLAGFLRDLPRNAAHHPNLAGKLA